MKLGTQTKKPNQNKKINRQTNRCEYITTALLVYDLTYWHLHSLIPLSRKKCQTIIVNSRYISGWQVRGENTKRECAIHAAFVFPRGEKCATIL